MSPTGYKGPGRQHWGHNFGPGLATRGVAGKQEQGLFFEKQDDEQSVNNRNSLLRPRLEGARHGDQRLIEPLEGVLSAQRQGQVSQNRLSLEADTGGVQRGGWSDQRSGSSQLRKTGDN